MIIFTRSDHPVREILHHAIRASRAVFRLTDASFKPARFPAI